MRHLRIVLGPTASGKTDYAAALARKLGSPVISCDSRQIYREMRIGTAVPSPELLAEVKHYFIQDHTVAKMYTAGMYELEAIDLIEKLFSDGHETLVMAGGSMFYVDAVCNGLDDMPPADDDLRQELTRRVREEGVDSLRMDLKRLDPVAYESIDLANPQRVLRAVEVCLLSGRPFSSFKLAAPKKRSFEIEKIGLCRPRDVLYDRINQRVDKMMEDGLVDEVRSLAEYRDTTALRTVGYSEIFSYLDGKCSLEQAVADIKTNTRHYAKRQMTWWKRDKDIRWIEL